MKGICVRSEIQPLKKVLLHRPGRELLNLIPDRLPELLFDDIPYLKVARQEHDAFAQILPDNGVEVAYLEALMTLPDIGPGRAQKILDYREAHGPFQNIFQLTEVPGIGEGIFNKLRDWIYVEDSNENTDY